jgi:hypothetical protein
MRAGETVKEWVQMQEEQVLKQEGMRKAQDSRCNSKRVSEAEVNRCVLSRGQVKTQMNK